MFIYLGFYVTFNTVQVISRRVVGRAEETSTYSSLGFCTVNCRPTASNYQLSHLRPYRESNPGLRGGRRECYHSPTVTMAYEGTNYLILVWVWAWKSFHVFCMKLYVSVDIFAVGFLTICVLFFKVMNVKVQCFGHL